eukprot:TRINITY_DN17747_c0_g1_i1.p1 TRINITY_DN17747_c0_g1~~TRINITY_DN17747_c0_g1_i1.p1  ORF type:complete len:1602 (+),score=530.35 TRINITY_DN17747_c0_g1_i1:228-5033(+)
MADAAAVAAAAVAALATVRPMRRTLSATSDEAFPPRPLDPHGSAGVLRERRASVESERADATNLALAIASLGRQIKQARKDDSNRRRSSTPADVLAVHKEYGEKLEGLRQIVRKTEQQVQFAQSKEEAMTRKHRQQVETQQRALHEQEAQLAESRRRYARVVADNEFVRNHERMLTSKLNALITEKRGPLPEGIPSASATDSGPSIAVEELLMLRRDNDHLRVQLAKLGQFDTESRGGLLRQAVRVQQGLRSARVLLSKLRAEAASVRDIIPNFMQPGGGFMEACDEYLDTNGELVARADLTSHAVACCGSLGITLTKIEQLLVRYRGNRGMMWREDPELQSMSDHGRSCEATSRALLKNAAEQGGLGRVPLTRIAAAFQGIETACAKMVEFTPRLLGEVRERTQKPARAFGRTVDEEATVPLSPVSPGPASPMTAATAKRTAVELQRLRAANDALQSDLLDALTQLRSRKVEQQPAEAEEAEAEEEELSPLPFKKPMVRKAEAAEQEEPLPTPVPLPKRRSSVADVAGAVVVARRRSSRVSKPVQAGPRLQLTSEARSVKATLRELFSEMSREMSAQERDRLRSLMDMAVESTRDSAKASFRVLMDELNLKKMLGCARTFDSDSPKPGRMSSVSRASFAASAMRRASDRSPRSADRSPKAGEEVQAQGMHVEAERDDDGARKEMRVCRSASSHEAASPLAQSGSVRSVKVDTPREAGARRATPPPDYRRQDSGAPLELTTSCVAEMLDTVSVASWGSARIGSPKVSTSAHPRTQQPEPEVTGDHGLGSMRVARVGVPARIGSRLANELQRGFERSAARSLEIRANLAAQERGLLRDAKDLLAKVADAREAAQEEQPAAPASVPTVPDVPSPIRVGPSLPVTPRGRAQLLPSPTESARPRLGARSASAVFSKGPSSPIRRIAASVSMAQLRPGRAGSRRGSTVGRRNSMSPTRQRRQSRRVSPPASPTRPAKPRSPFMQYALEAEARARDCFEAVGMDWGPLARWASDVCGGFLCARGGELYLPSMLHHEANVVMMRVYGGEWSDLPKLSQMHLLCTFTAFLSDLEHADTRLSVREGEEATEPVGVVTVEEQAVSAGCCFQHPPHARPPGADIAFHVADGVLWYTVDGQKRPAVREMRLSLSQLTLTFPELGRRIWLPRHSPEVLGRVLGEVLFMCQRAQVAHNIPSQFTLWPSKAEPCFGRGIPLKVLLLVASFCPRKKRLKLGRTQQAVARLIIIVPRATKCAAVAAAIASLVGLQVEAPSLDAPATEAMRPAAPSEAVSPSAARTVQLRDAPTGGAADDTAAEPSPEAAPRLSLGGSSIRLKANRGGAADGGRRAVPPSEPAPEEAEAAPERQPVDNGTWLSVRRRQGELLGLHLSVADLQLAAVDAGSAADRAGLRAMIGRKLTHVGSDEVSCAKEAADLLSALSSAAVVRVRFEATAAAASATARPASRPQRPPGIRERIYGHAAYVSTASAVGSALCVVLLADAARRPAAGLRTHIPRHMRIFAPPRGRTPPVPSLPHPSTAPAKAAGGRGGGLSSTYSGQRLPQISGDDRPITAPTTDRPPRRERRALPGLLPAAAADLGAAGSPQAMLRQRFQ